jgi:hypothetical protein
MSMSAHDPTRLALTWALSPVTWAKECVGFVADEWQTRVLTSPAPIVLLCCSRQVGKTSVACLLALHEVMFRAGALALIIGPSRRQTSEALRKVKSFTNAITFEHRPVFVEESRDAIAFSNGSRVVALPSDESTTRGYPGVSLVVEDEAARVADAVHDAVRPALATCANGRHILLSTPSGCVGHFHALWSGTEPAERIRITASECSRIDVKFLERERRRLSARVYAQEYEATFADAAESFFRSDAVLAAFTDTIKPLECAA